MFLGKGVLKIWSKFTGEHPYRSAIPIKLHSNFIETALWHGCSPLNLLHIFRTPFPKNTSVRLLLKDIDKNVASFLSLGPNLIPAPKSIPYMEISTTIESQALNLESSKKDTSAENLRQTVSKILSKTTDKK